MGRRFSLRGARSFAVGLTPSRSFGSLFSPVISLFPTPPPHPSPCPPPRSIVSPRACSSSPSRIRRLPPRRECKSEKEREIELEIALSRVSARARASEPVVALVRLLPAIGELEHRDRVNFLTISARDTASPANARQLERRIASPSPSLGRFGH